MRILLDTNILVDVLERRKGFFEDSYTVIQLAAQEKIECFLSAGAVTDVYYIIRRSIKDPVKAKESIIGLTALIGICDTMARDINTAMSLDISDFEDAVAAAVALRIKAEYIITRNTKDFVNSPVPARAPAEFLKFFAGSPRSK
jgi:predicted nucleic acid-binding protein